MDIIVEHPNKVYDMIICNPPYINDCGVSYCNPNLLLIKYLKDIKGH